MSISNPVAEPETALARVEQLLRHLDRRLSEVGVSVAEVAHDLRHLRRHSDSLAEELGNVEDRLATLHIRDGAAASGPYERCQECGRSVWYVEAMAGWTTSCQLCHWSDFQEDPAHARRPPNLAG